MDMDTLLWTIFAGLVVVMLCVDLGFFHRKAHVVALKEALAWTFVWIMLALLFCVGIWLCKEPEDALNFFAAYLIEKSLSIDNLFVFVMIFTYFSVPDRYQHKILFWGILGALLMRAIFIFAGIALLNMFHWVIYIFGAFLVYSGLKLALEKEHKIHPDKNPVVKMFRKVLVITDDYVGSKFFAKKEAKWVATPLLVVLLVVESTDVVFAVDSIPAVLAITKDPFIAYTSNVFAILGLRALYFALAGILKYFCYLRFGLALVLSLVGVKMVLSGTYKVSAQLSLGLIVGILTVTMIASLLWPAKKEKTLPAAGMDEEG